MEMSVELGKKFGEYDEGKCWFSRRGNILTIGVTSQAIDLIGDVESLELPEEGDRFQEGDILATIDGSLTAIEVESPKKGVVIEVNLTRNDAEKIQEDPLEEGWILKLQMDG
jgi:glycine cleavage system H protein